MADDEDIPEELLEQEPQDDPDGTGELVVVRDEDDDDVDVRGEVDRPDKLLRLAGMIRGMLNQVRTLDLDESGRKRLTEFHNDVVEELRELVSDDLEEELTSMEIEGLDDAPTGSELRVAQAQLGGWLEGLFHGIQASMATQQAAQRQQLMQQLEQRQGGQQQQPSPGSRGQYL